MPILITIATIKILFSDGSGDEASFLNPAALRKAIESLPDDSNRDAALPILDTLDALAQDYDDDTDAAMGIYTADVEKWSSTAEALIEDLQPLDQTRADTLTSLIELRRRLADTLSPEEWEAVFG